MPCRQRGQRYRSGHPERPAHRSPVAKPCVDVRAVEALGQWVARAAESQSSVAAESAPTSISRARARLVTRIIGTPPPSRGTEVACRRCRRPLRPRTCRRVARARSHLARDRASGRAPWLRRSPIPQHEHLPGAGPHHRGSVAAVAVPVGDRHRIAGRTDVVTRAIDDDLRAPSMVTASGQPSPSTSRRSPGAGRAAGTAPTSATPAARWRGSTAGVMVGLVAVVVGDHGGRGGARLRVRRSARERGTSAEADDQCRRERQQDRSMPG